MELQKKWYEAGTETTEAFSELMNFEKSFRPNLEKKIREYDDLDDRAGKLAGKLTAETVDLNTRKVAIFAGMREAATKIRSDLQAKAGTPANKKSPPEDIEGEIASKLESKAKAGAAEIHSYGLDILKIERDLAEIQVKKFLLAEEPFQLRRQAARKFFLSLIQTAGIGIYYQTSDSSIGQTEAWSAKLKEVELRIAIMEGTVAKFAPIGYGATSPDDVLSFAAQLPKESLSGLIEAWTCATAEKARKIKLTYDRSRSLKWFITRSKPETRDLLTTHDMGFDVASSSDRKPYSTSRQRAKD